MWTNLNLGMDLLVYGVKYHIADCETFKTVTLLTGLQIITALSSTGILKISVWVLLSFPEQTFLTSEGILTNYPEPEPEDPYN